MRTRRLALCAVAVTVGVLTTATPAAAYNPTTLTGAQTGDQCSPGRFSSGSVKVVLHLAESKATLAQQNEITDAVYWINSEIGLVGGSTAYVSSTTTTNTAFTFGSWFGDTTPTVHVGFAGNLASDVGGVTRTGPFSLATCTYTEAHVVLPDLNSRTWDFDTPGTDYWQAGQTSAGSALWLRPTYLHELLHAFGVAHADKDYAIMNYGVMPWLNRVESAMMQPLPDDVKALRALYPGTGTRNEVAALNTWYDPNDVSSTGAAVAKPLCRASLGADYDTDKFAATCGTGGAKSGATNICAGDKVRVRYAIANYGTAKVYVVAQVYFSSDLTYGSTDYPSTSAFTLWVNPGGAKIVTASAEVPTMTGLSGLTVHPILRVSSWQDTDGDGVTEGGTLYTTWNPLSGWLSAC